MVDPTDVQVFDALSHLLECDLQGVISTPEDILEAFHKYYSDDINIDFEDESDVTDEITDDFYFFSVSWRYALN